MMRRILVPVIALCLGLHLQACSSSGSKDESDVASNDQTFAEEGEGDFADGGGDKSSDKSADQAAPDKSGDLASADAPPPADDAADDLSLGDEKEKPVAAADAATGDQPPAGDDLSLDDGTAVAKSDAPPTDEPLFTEESKPVEPAPTENIASNDPTPAPEAAPEAAPVEPVPSVAKSTAPVVYAPLLKVKDAAFTGPGGVTLNRVYVARPKDTAKNVSEKIYGSNRSKDLVKWNPVLRRGMRTGDKVYYTSTVNPSDTRMVNYYEEQNVPPQVYVSKPGDNLRKVSKSLLGFNDAWKEVWVTNANVESKGNLAPGLELRFWPAQQSAPTMPMAANTGLPPKNSGLPEAAPAPAPAQPMPQPVAAVAPPPQPAQDPLAPPPPAEQMAANEPPPPAPPEQPANPTNVAGTTAPPPPDPIAPPPPPPIEPPKKMDAKPVKPRPAAAAADTADGGMDSETTMMIGLGGILLIAAAILFVVIRKNRAKRLDLGQTQV